MKKNLLLISLFACIAAVASAQFNTVWEAPYQHTSANNYSNEGRKIALDPAGNIFVLADVTSNINPNGTTVTNTQYYVVLLKYNTQGLLIGERAISTRGHFASGFDQVNSFGLVVDASGNVYVGHSRYDATNLHDVYITKVNGTTMNVLWNHNFTSLSNDRGIQLRVMSGVAYALFSSTDAGSTSSIYKIFKASTAGSTSAALYTFQSGDVINDFVVDASQNSYCTGYRIINNIKNVLSVRISTAGVLNWSKVNAAGSTTGDTFGTSCHLSSDNYFYIIGTSNRANTGADAVIIKYALNNGAIQYTTYQHRNNQDAGKFITTIQGGSILMTGCTSGPDAVFFERGNASTGVRINRLVYQPQPASPFSSIVSVSLNDMKNSTADNFYVCGTIRANIVGQSNFTTGYFAKISWDASLSQLKLMFFNVATGGPNKNSDNKALALDAVRTDVLMLRDEYFSFTSHQQESVVVIDYDVPSPLRTIETSPVNELSAVYAPADNLIYVQADNVVESAIVCDITGRTVLTANPHSDYFEISTAQLPRGIYIIRTQSGISINTRKINIF